MHHSSADFQDYELDPKYDIQPMRKRVKRNRPHKDIAPVLVEAGDDSLRTFKPSYTGSKHEHEWIMQYLGPFYSDHLLADVLRQVKGGKEATVYCCRAHPATGLELLAAKVYRPRMFRQLRNDAVYRRGREVIGEEGKEVRGRREKLAMKKKTEFGHKLRHITWLANEFETLQRLYSVGVAVPKPLATSENAILMEHIGDEAYSAPPLTQVHLDPSEATSLFHRLLHDIELMLQHDRIHADLSAFNVLYWEGEIKIIDMPQAVDPYVNPEAFRLLQRDVERICQYFSRYGISASPAEISQDLWNRCILHQDRIT